MTSQKSLRSKVNLQDFKRSLGSAWLFPLVALAVFVIGVILPVSSQIREMSSEQLLNGISIFFYPNSIIITFSLLPIGMVLCGFMTAARQFNFLMSKKSVNVYLSMGISRTALFVNRVLSSALTLLLAVLLPMTVLYCINLSAFGASVHLTQIYLYSVSALVTSGLVGFSIGAFSMMISGNILEATLVGGCISGLPSLLFSLFSGVLIPSFLKGYVRMPDVLNMAWTSLLSPFTFVCSLAKQPQSSWDYFSNRITPETVLSYTESTEKTAKVVSADLAVNKNFWIPILVGFLLALCLILLGGISMKVRKAEHAKSFGNFVLSRAIGTVTLTVGVMFICAALWSDADYSSEGLLWLLCLLCMAAAVFLVQLLWTRKLRKALHALTVGAVAFALLSVGFLTVTTDVFGTYNRMPDKAEVESVSADLLPVNSLPAAYRIRPESELLESKSEKDKDLCLRLMDLVQNDKQDTKKKDANDLDTVTFAIRMKNGRVKFRSYEIHTPEVYAAYQKEMLESDFFDSLLKAWLLEKNYDEKTGKVISEIKGQLRADYMQKNDANHMDDIKDSIVESGRSWYLAPGNGLVHLHDGEFETAPLESEEFYQTLYNDLSAMTYAQFEKQTDAPIKMLANAVESNLSFSYKDRIVQEYYNESESKKNQPLATDFCVSGIPLYANMTETLRYLDKIHAQTQAGMDAKVSEIYYAEEKISAVELLSRYVKKHDIKENNYKYRYGYLMKPSVSPYAQKAPLEYQLSRNNAVGIENKQASLYKWLFYLHEQANVSLKKAEPKQYDAILKKLPENVYQLGDDGRYVYIVYDNGYMEYAYLPAESCDLLK